VTDWRVPSESEIIRHASHSRKHEIGKHYDDDNENDDDDELRCGPTLADDLLDLLARRTESAMCRVHLVLQRGEKAVLSNGEVAVNNPWGKSEALVEW